jgi:hypothetical protein
MNCPKCGLQALAQQKFCRSCGASLQMITQRLPDTVTVSELVSQPKISQEMYRTNRLLLWGLIIMFIGAAIGVIGKMLMHEEVVTVVGVLVSLAGIFLSVYPYLLPSPRTRYNFISSSQPERQIQSQPPKSLPDERTIDYAASVTERTTDLLENSVATPKQKEGGKQQA